MKEHLFLVNVVHNGMPFGRGSLCPHNLVEEMKQKGLVEPAPQAAKPAEEQAPKAKAKKE